MGKGLRTAPRDALVADSTEPSQRGLAFGIHRAGDTAGAVVGLLVAIGIVWSTQGQSRTLSRPAFMSLVLLSLAPAALAVAGLAILRVRSPSSVGNEEQTTHPGGSTVGSRRSC